jgi:two-component system, NarL family, response regulator LiaR
MMERKIRVMIADDHLIVRSGLAALLMTLPDIELAAEASNGQEALERCYAKKPDVILMDLMMPVMDGIRAIRAIRQKHPEIKVVALTSFQDEHLVQGALQAGAAGYLMKNVTGEELAAAVRRAHQGRLTLSPEASQALIQSACPSADSDLSEREREVLAGMVEGLSNSEIAGQLVISLSTARYHISSIYRKLGVKDRTGAVKLALLRKLV